MARALLLATLVLSACGPALSPAEHYERGIVAIDAGDASEARRHLRAAGRAGHLHASSTLAQAYASGSFRQTQARGTGPDAGARLLATRQSDWEAQRWSQHFLQLVRRPAQDPEVRHMQALDWLNGRPDGSDAGDLPLGVVLRAPHASPAQRDSATAILRQLVDEGHVEAAHSLAWMSPSDAERERWLTTAVALGSTTACRWKALLAQGPTAEEIAATFDAAEACEAMPGWSPPADYAAPRATALRKLREQTARGNAEARALLRELTAIGAFPDA